ncbi:MAG TPA: type I polyketide synthase, partial [Vicinamibacterales bacterium]|nr:type I polyketide synthase [Vicinamibacterales bacterium]
MDDPIAIIGIGCRFPGGADHPQAFWQLLADGFNAVTEAPASRSGFIDCFDADPKKPGHAYSRWGGFLDRVDLFDAQFFGISPREAAHIDPQHRLLLELVWEACENASVAPSALAGSRTGVFVGISTHDYGDLQMYPANRDDIDMHTNSGTATSIAANRLSYIYDLRGPSVAVDTACSSSLTAVHFSCQSLRAGECDVAFAAGVQILLTPELTIGFCKASMLSPDGECRAFDADANGYVRSEGAGVVMLKPLAAALRDGDPIHAVIRATAINQDGRTNGMTVPSPRAQQAMIEEALGKAGIAPRDVHYVEAHGPGTRVGDPIEAAAISAAMRVGRPAGELCAIGSVKTNLGHLEAASGMPGLIKVALALGHRQIPPSLHFARPNDAIDLEALGLRVVTTLEPWPQPHRPAIAGVNSFGFGGANAHVLLEEPPRRVLADEPLEAETARMLVLSARSPEALKTLAVAYAARLGDADAPRLRDLCFTSGERRAHHELRLSVVASRRHDFVNLLSDFAAGGSGAGLATGRLPATGAPPLAFVCSGMGPQWWGMGRQLRQSEPVFRRMLERCDEVLRPLAGWSLLEELAADEATSRVADPELAQVTNFALQLALADLWASWGIIPAAVIGHSGGAMAAACIAGVYDLDEAMRLSFHRSRLQGRPANAGRMLAVGAPYDEIAGLLAGIEDRVSLAAVNGPAAITLAGDGETIEKLAATLLERQIFARVLAVTIAYHSPAMDAIKDEFLTAMTGLCGRATRLPWLSDTTGAWAEGESCDAEFWWRAIRQPVLFRDGIRAILDTGITHFVELSPHPVLASAVADCMKEHGTKGLVLPSLRRKDDEDLTMRRSLGALYAAGCAPAWPALREDGARVTALPLYPWQRERHWFEPAAAAGRRSGLRTAQAGDHPLLGGRAESARPTWDTMAGTAATAYLHEHIVQDGPVFPGAAYVEMALAARTALDGDTPMVLRDVEFIRALRLGADGGTRMQCALDPVEGRVEMFSTNATGGAWTCHARAVITPGRRGDQPSVDLGELRARFPKGASASDFYARMAERGLTYGAAFRGIERLWVKPGEAFAHVASAAVAGVTGYRAHPALLDAAFQALVAAAESAPGMSVGRQLFLPTMIREVRWHADPGAAFWVTAVAREITGQSVTGDLRLIDLDGQVCADVFGFTARLIEAADERARESVDQWLYDYRWESQALDLRRDGMPGAGDSVPVSVIGTLPADAALDAVRRRATGLATATGWRAYDDHVETRLNEIAAAYVVEALTGLGGGLAPDARFSPETLGPAAATGWRRALAEQLFRQLALAGMMRPLGDAWQATGVVPSTTAAALSVQLLAAFPAHRLDVELLGRAGPRLADVLAGRVDGRDVLFTDDGFRFLEQFYRESPASAFYNAQVADLVTDLCERSAPGR